jgi:hypothetical protein
MTVSIYAFAALAAAVAAWFLWRRYRSRPAVEAAGESSGRRRSGAALVYTAPDPGPRHFQPRRPAAEAEPGFDIPTPQDRSAP